jgi:hypothetical protein
MQKALVYYYPLTRKDQIDVELELQRLTQWAFENRCTEVAVLPRLTEPYQLESLYRYVVAIGATTIILPSLRCFGLRAKEQANALRLFKRHRVRVLARSERYDSADPASDDYNMGLYYAAKSRHRMIDAPWLS